MALSHTLIVEYKTSNCIGCQRAAPDLCEIRPKTSLLICIKSDKRDEDKQSEKAMAMAMTILTIENHNHSDLIINSDTEQHL